MSGTVRRLAVAWSGEPDWPAGWRVEIATVELTSGGLRAMGSQLGRDPVPYRIDYELDATGYGFLTRSLHVEARGAGWRRELHLERAVHGSWTIGARAEGAPDMAGSDAPLDLPQPGGDATALADAFDCDLGFSPLTNAMPVRRHELHRRPGQVDFLMAWVSVPDLSVQALAQRYTHIRRRDSGAGAVVRYESVVDGTVVFTADLEVDADGLVRLYPGLAGRIDDKR
jgi:uncharacterized protein